jgi:inositol hexakisphosphate/diphosphoinositol-pentakisphosphate kinase
MEEDSDFDYNDENNQPIDTIKIGICAMAKKVNSKPMQEILSRLQKNLYFNVIIFEQDLILNVPVNNWPICDCLISFYSKDFPLKKAQEYVKLYNPFVINDLDKQWDIMDRYVVF